MFAFGSRRVLTALVAGGVLVASSGSVYASEVSVSSVVDATAPTGSVSLSPGGEGAITINLSVTGNQDGTATFEVYRTWTLSGGVFTGSNPIEFSVAPRNGGDAATTFSTTGTVKVAAGQAATTQTLTVQAFDITNSNTTGGKLAVGTASTYSVTVTAAATTDPCLTVAAPAAPTITPDATQPNGSGGYFTSVPNVSASTTTTTATLEFATQVAGGAKSSYSATAPTLGQGSTVVYAKATSATCNKTSESSATFNVDSIAPAISGTNVVDAVWRNTDRSASFTATDDGSGLAAPLTDGSFSITATLESVSEDQPTVAPRTVFDVAGNSSTRSVSALIDKTRPTLTDAGVVSPGLPNAADWYTAAVTNRFNRSDALSGLLLAEGETAQLDVSTGTRQGAVTVSSGTASDRATNTRSAVTSATYNVDLTDPTNVQFTGGPAADSTSYFGFVPTAPSGCTAEDAISGVKSCSVGGYSTAVGTHTMTATATDNADRTASARRSYTVSAWDLRGFYAPVDMGDTVNTVKGGSTVPLKFEVFAGNTELTDTAVVKPLLSKETTCATGPEDTVEVLATGSTSLRYDTTGGQFIYNWQTPKTVGKCYSVTVATADGSLKTAKFKTK